MSDYVSFLENEVEDLKDRLEKTEDLLDSAVCLLRENNLLVEKINDYVARENGEPIAGTASFPVQEN